MEQHIRRIVDPKTFDAIAAGTQTFEIVRGNIDIAPDDYCTYLEQLPEGSEKAPRSVLRRVRSVISTDAAGIPNDELARYGATVVGFGASQYTGLELLLQEGSNVVAFAVAKYGDDVEVVEGPAYLPPLNCPAVPAASFLDTMETALWPAGHYSVMLQVRFRDVMPGARVDADVVDSIIMVRSQHDDRDVFVMVDLRYLRLGKLKDLANNAVMPYFGDDGFDEADPIEETEPAALGDLTPYLEEDDS